MDYRPKISRFARYHPKTYYIDRNRENNVPNSVHQVLLNNHLIADPEPKFWIENPIILFRSTTIIPDCNMTYAEKMNAISRAIIILSAILFLFKSPLWSILLVGGLLLVIMLWYHDKNQLRKQVNLTKFKSDQSKTKSSQKNRIIVKRLDPI